MAAERSELTPEEAALLTDPQALERARSKAGDGTPFPPRYDLHISGPNPS